MGGDERVETAGELAVAPEAEERLDPVFRGGEAKLLEAVDLVTREVVEGELGECRAPPERERLVEHARRLLWRPLLERAATVTCQLLEAGRIHRDRIGPECVAGRLRDEQAVRIAGFPFGLEHAAQMRHVALDGFHGGAGRLTAPEGVDDPIGRDDLAAVDQ